MSVTAIDMSTPKSNNNASGPTTASHGKTKPGIHVEKHYASTPTPVPPFSSRMVTDNRCEVLDTQFQDNFVRKAFEVLERYGVDFDDVDLCPLVRGYRLPEPTLQILRIGRYTRTL